MVARKQTNVSVMAAVSCRASLLRGATMPSAPASDVSKVPIRSPKHTAAIAARSTAHFNELYWGKRKRTCVQTTYRPANAKHQQQKCEFSPKPGFLPIQNVSTAIKRDHPSDTESLRRWPWTKPWRHYLWLLGMHYFLAVFDVRGDSDVSFYFCN